jgi:hypothetical protein
MVLGKDRALNGHNTLARSFVFAVARVAVGKTRHSDTSFRFKTRMYRLSAWIPCHIFGRCVSIIQNWQNNVTVPSQNCRARVIAFLRYNPYASRRNHKASDTERLSP